METELVKIEKLQNATEWTRWKFQIKVLLNASELFDVVNGDNPKPIPDQSQTAAAQSIYELALKTWKKLDFKAQKIIATTVGPQPLIHIMNCDTAKGMWEKLHRVYEQKSETSIHVLLEKYYAFKMDQKDSIATHISKIEDLAQQLKDMGEILSPAMVVTRILSTLPSSYAHFNSAWESTAANDRTMENLTARLIVEEARIKKNVTESSPESGAFVAKNFVSKNWNRNSKPGKCHRCGKFGHWRRDCPETKKERSEANRERVENKNERFEGGSSYAHNSWEDESEAFMGESFANEIALFSSARYGNGWFLDSGASDHMSNNRGWFNNLKMLSVPIPVRIGNGKFIYALGRGEIDILVFDGERWNRKRLLEVLYIPDIQLQLISLSAALDKNLTFSANSTQCFLKRNERIVAVGDRNKRLFEMRIKVVKCDEQNKDGPTTFMANRSENMKLWHDRLGHQNIVQVQQILDQMGIACPKMKNFFCDACVIGKQHRLPFKRSSSTTNNPAELIHSDVCGPMQVSSIGGSRFFLLFKDDYSHYRTVFFLKQKSEVKHCIATYLRQAKVDTGFDVKLFRSDNGLEFTNIDVDKLFKEIGIRHQRTVIYTPEQNGSAEREMRTIVESARTMLHAKNLPTSLWAEATNTAVYILNRTGTSSVKAKTPFELWFGKSPSINHFRVFGSKVFVHIPKEKRKKWDRKSEEGVFVGYSDNVKGYRVWLPNTNKVVVRRDIIFKENVPILNDENVKSGREESSELSEASSSVSEFAFIPLNLNLSKSAEDIMYPTIGQNLSINETPPIDQSFSNNESDPHLASSPEVINISSSSSTEGVPTSPTQTPNTSGPISSRLRDIDPIPNYKDLTSSSLDESLFAAESLEPLTFEQAVQCCESKYWIEAIDDEFKSLIENDTWSLEELPAGRKAISNKWVFKIKYGADGNIQRYKARLVVRGFSQQHGIDYKETFSPVAKFSSIRALLAVATAEKMFFKQFDVKTAFLNGELEEEIFMKQPIGFDDHSGKVCRLKRSLYGLKQASRVWNKRFTEFLRSFGLEMSNADPCVFIGKKSGKNIYLAIYIDDGMVASHDKFFIDQLLHWMNKEFQTTALELQYFLGLEIELRQNGSTFIHQAAYVKRLLNKFGMNECHPSSTPLDQHFQISASSHPNECKHAVNVPYREAVGSLMYLVTGSRPDIAFAVGVVSRYLENPLEIHWNAIKRIFRYLKGTSNYGISYNSNVKNNLVGYSDADYGGDIDTRRSTTGFFFKIGSGPISWCSQRQKTVALSTTEAEYIAASESLRELIWLQVLMTEIAPSPRNLPLLMVDNQSAIKLTKNPELHKRSKHIDIRHHFIREKYSQGSFVLSYIDTENQIADVLTKALPKDRFIKLRSMMGVTQ